MKKWGLLSVLVGSFLLASCGTDKNKQEDDQASFYSQFITKDNGIENGNEVSVVSLQLSGFQSYNGIDTRVENFKLDMDSNGTFYIYTDMNQVQQGGNDAPLKYGKSGNWTVANGVLTLEGVGSSQTAAVSNVNYNNFNSFNNDLCSQNSNREGCMNVNIPSDLELSAALQGSFYGAGRMYVPGPSCYQICRK